MMHYCSSRQIYVQFDAIVYQGFRSRRLLALFELQRSRGAPLHVAVRLRIRAPPSFPPSGSGSI